MGDASVLCAMMESSGGCSGGAAAEQRLAVAAVVKPKRVLHLETESGAGFLLEQHTNYDGGGCGIGKMGELDKSEEEKKKPPPPRKQQQQLGKVKKRIPNVEPELTWEEKVVSVLDIIRRHQLTEYNPKSTLFTPTRFCFHNMAFFDLDKESEIVLGSLIRSIPYSIFLLLEGSVNVIAIKIAKSDVGYPISIFGTVLARDACDYRCVYLFRCDRDHPQLITSLEDTLTLTGPKRGLASKGSMYFEFNLKTKGDGAADKDFSKGVLEHNTIAHEKPLMTLPLYSFMSTVEFIYTPCPYAVQATLAVNFLEGPSNFTGTVTAWTTGNDENEIILYDSKVPGTQTIVRNGRVALTRNMFTLRVAVKLHVLCLF